MMQVATAIEDLLRARAGERLNKTEIALALNLPLREDRYGRECMRELEYTLFQLAEERRISSALPNSRRPEFNFWIDPPAGTQASLFEEAHA
jgi:hypothetical protein